MIHLRCSAALTIAALSLACTRSTPGSEALALQLPPIEGCYLLHWTPEAPRPHLDSLYLSWRWQDSTPAHSWSHPFPCAPMPPDSFCGGDLLVYAHGQGQFVVVAQVGHYGLVARPTAGGFVAKAWSDVATWAPRYAWEVRAERVSCS